ncbi:hypothetical protein CFN78_15275 [Amycolatopsis antarctica]|uniref:Uncharacterized protein n=1 Tax=Amycolatopsis antarctica TaxID=1854586 RepID=A0A263D4G3_9PSEU|nr:hypothetical protein CFN78_15275 [Amycolatopsis antarctica]
MDHDHVQEQKERCTVQNSVIEAASTPTLDALKGRLPGAEEKMGVFGALTTATLAATICGATSTPLIARIEVAENASVNELVSARSTALAG